MSTRVFYQSDLHLEHLVHQTSAFGDAVALFAMLPEGDTSQDILVIAGDIWNDATNSLLYSGGSWLKTVASRFRDVIIVFGNHCWYGTSFKNMEAKFATLLDEQGINNVHVMNDGCWVDPISNVLFVGGTLWTDFDKESPLLMFNAATVMNDYRYIRTKSYSKISANLIATKHFLTRKHIEHIISNNKDKHIVVVTHHLPSFQLISEEYRGDPNNAYYASDLDEMIIDNPQIKQWVFGHTHITCDKMIGDTRCLSNSYGYKGSNTQFDRNAHFIV